MMQPDPRTLAREIPGIVEELFPQLTPGTVSHINSKIQSFEVQRIPDQWLNNTKIQKAMLFEVAYAVGESYLTESEELNWEECVAIAIKRQQNFFDAKIPDQIGRDEKAIAQIVGRNLANIVNVLCKDRRASLSFRPTIPGLEWISNGKGDFALDSCLLEVKCTAARFSSADYRQVAIYWLLSFAASIEGRGEEWKTFTLVNPRRGELITMKFDTLIGLIGGFRTKVEILQSFLSLIGSRNMKS